MLRRLEQSHDHVIGYSMSGDIGDDEYTQMTSELRDEIARHGRIRVLLRLSDLSLSSFFSAIEERFRFLKDHHDHVERVAVVTDEIAIDVLSRMTEVVRGIETETFSSEDEPKAWAWLE